MRYTFMVLLLHSKNISEIYFINGYIYIYIRYTLRMYILGLSKLPNLLYWVYIFDIPKSANFTARSVYLGYT